jgi:hypothetical protein
MSEDLIVLEVRRIKEGLAAKYGYDLKKIVASYKRARKGHGRKLVRAKPGRMPASRSTK